MIIVDGAIKLVNGVFDGWQLVIVAHHFIDSLLDIIVDIELMIGDLLAFDFEDAGGGRFGADWAADTAWVNKEITPAANLEIADVSVAIKIDICMGVFENLTTFFEGRLHVKRHKLADATERIMRHKNANLVDRNHFLSRKLAHERSGMVANLTMIPEK